MVSWQEDRPSQKPFRSIVNYENLFAVLAQQHPCASGAKVQWKQWRWTERKGCSGERKCLIVLLCYMQLRVPKSAFGPVVTRKHTHTAYFAVRGLGQEGNEERQTQRKRLR